MPRFGRILTAMVTPFDAQGDLNVDAAVRLANGSSNRATRASSSVARRASRRRCRSTRS
jgi:dihydrodipicolinate synthase/N-acetylneuraminate lyase